MCVSDVVYTLVKLGQTRSRARLPRPATNGKLWPLNMIAFLGCAIVRSPFGSLVWACTLLAARHSANLPDVSYHCQGLVEGKDSGAVSPSVTCDAVERLRVLMAFRNFHHESMRGSTPLPALTSLSKQWAHKSYGAFHFASLKFSVEKIWTVTQFCIYRHNGEFGKWPCFKNTAFSICHSCKMSVCFC